MKIKPGLQNDTLTKYQYKQGLPHPVSWSPKVEAWVALRSVRCQAGKHPGSAQKSGCGGQCPALTRRALWLCGWMPVLPSETGNT